MEDRLTLLDHDEWLPSLTARWFSGHAHPLFFFAKKAARVSHSTSHAEGLVSAGTSQMSRLIALRLTEPFMTVLCKVPSLAIKDMIEYQNFCLPVVPVDQVTDCMDVFELCCGAKGVPSDKMQRIIILSLREDRLRGNIRSFMHWPTAVMLADGLTKVGTFPQLMCYCTSGTFRIELPEGKHIRQRTRLANMSGHTEEDLLNLNG